MYMAVCEVNRSSILIQSELLTQKTVAICKFDNISR